MHTVLVQTFQRTPCDHPPCSSQTEATHGSIQALGCALDKLEPALHSPLHHDLAARRRESNGGRSRRGGAGDSHGSMHVAMSRGSGGGSTVLSRARPPLRSPSPPGPLSHPQHAQHQPEHAAPAPCRARRAPPKPVHGRAKRPHAPERATPPLLAHLVPQTARSVAAPLHRPTASTHGRGCPLHRVHRAPPGHYKAAPVSGISPHHSTALLSPSPLSRAPLDSPGRGSKASGHRALPRARRARGRRRPRLGRAVSPRRSPLPLTSSPCTPHSPASFSPLDRAQERRQSLAGVAVPPRRRSCSSPSLGATPASSARPRTFPDSPPSFCTVCTPSRAP